MWRAMLPDEHYARKIIQCTVLRASAYQSLPLDLIYVELEAVTGLCVKLGRKPHHWNELIACRR